MSASLGGAIAGELKALALWWLGLVPGNFGRRVRGTAMRWFLGRLGTRSVFQPGMTISAPRNVTIGSHGNFAQRVSIRGEGGVTIGDWVGFGPDVKISSVSERFADPDVPWMQQGVDFGPVVIENDVWLGANVFVAPGVTIGQGAIVSASAVVTKSVPPFAIVAGNPGRVIGWRKTPTGESSAAAAAPTAAQGEHPAARER